MLRSKRPGCPGTQSPRPPSRAASPSGATSYPEAAGDPSSPGGSPCSPGSPGSPGSTHRHARRVLAAAVAAGLLAAGCQTVPVTGRTALNVFPPSWDHEIGAQAFQETIAGQRTVTSGPELAMVEEVMRRIVAASDDPGYEWEVELLDDDQMANAFALPGGKMAVFTGILPITKDEAGLAVVMAHEIAHVIARHGAQRMSQAAGTELLFQLWNGGQTEELARMAVQFGVELPYGRSHETEADHIGLIYMARAGYDPRNAVDFWTRMAQAGGEGPPEFLSTHPSTETRIAQLEELMPEALREYRAATGAP